LSGLEVAGGAQGA